MLISWEKTYNRFRRVERINGSLIERLTLLIKNESLRRT